MEKVDGKSKSNIDEAYFAYHLFSSLDKETNGLLSNSKVAIITPYSQQVSLLKDLFEKKYGDHSNLVDISTVDSFQGKEAKIVIFSCVRASRKGVGELYDASSYSIFGLCTYIYQLHLSGIGFLNDIQRMNVALTRAKHFLFVIARCRTIIINPYWRDLISYARSQRAILKVVAKRQNQVQNKKKNEKICDLDIFPNLKSLKPIHPLKGLDDKMATYGVDDGESDISA